MFLFGDRFCRMSNPTAKSSFYFIFLCKKTGRQPRGGTFWCRSKVIASSQGLCVIAHRKKKNKIKKNRKEFTEHEGKNNFKTTKKVDARLVSSPFAAGVHRHSPGAKLAPDPQRRNTTTTGLRWNLSHLWNSTLLRYMMRFTSCKMLRSHQRTTYPELLIGVFPWYITIAKLYVYIRIGAIIITPKKCCIHCEITIWGFFVWNRAETCHLIGKIVYVIRKIFFRFLSQELLTDSFHIQLCIIVVDIVTYSTPETPSDAMENLCHHFEKSINQ